MDLTDRITGLPVELLGEIFSCWSADFPDAPLAIRSVCRALYVVTEVTPHLWTNLKIVARDDATAAQKAAYWFTKSGACAMLLSITMDDSGGGGRYVTLSTTLAQYRTRIASLTVHAQTEKHVQLFLSSIYLSTGAPLDVSLYRYTLRLAVRVDNDYTTPDTVPLFPPLSAPLLLVLNLATPTVPDLSTINFASLQSLCIARPIRSSPVPMEMILGALSASPCLRDFHLETRFNLSSEPVQPPEHRRTPLITLLKLTSLSLRTNLNPALLNVLVLPELRALHLNALDGRRPGRAEETASALRLLLIRMDDPSVTLSNPSVERGILELALSGVAITRPCSAIARNELWEWCFRRMRSLRRITARNMDTEHLVELLAQGMGRLSAPAYMRLGHGSEGSADTGERMDDAVCPRLEYLGVPLPEASAAMKAFRVARPYVKVRALGYGFNTYSSEDALRARRLNVNVRAEETDMNGAVMDVVGSRKPTSGPLDLDARGVSAEALELSKPVEPSAVEAPPTPRVIVGGFGFGSPFARRRPRP
ncbi:hypothetical protein LshimejAT787_3300070 [Lyophyllum shimeji]|uniref:F-box domain-containing protein n=1 Tax=Lyophyllum shimeji TaxID=47721 RepID=A0A9P3Q383_LYOSH|nr:hypothetical protein LshimejAT787_3300070 [Lyophyllum shimeji]